MRKDAPSMPESMSRLRARLEGADTLGEVIDIVRVSSRRLVTADGTTFVLRDGDHCFYADEDSIAPLWKGQRFPITACISGWAMLHEQPTVVPDILVDDRIPQDAYRPTYIASMVMVPIGLHKPVGAIGAYWARRHRATVGDVDALQPLAELAAEAVARVGLDSAPWAPSRHITTASLTTAG
jgi:GAF domain-containing protein